MNVLVTGVAGFIGSHLAERLLNQEGVTMVRGVDNLSTGRLSNLVSFEDKMDFRKGDLLDEGVRKDALKDIDVVFHVAAIPSVPRSVDDPINSHLQGAHLTMLLLAGSVEAGVNRFVYSASSSAYGNTQVMPKQEDMQPNPMSPYAATKLAGEYYLKSFAACYALDTCALRYFNIFGPRQDPGSPYSGVLSKLCTAFCNDGDITIFGDGEQSRDFTYVDNAVEANICAMRFQGKLDGQVFNVGCGESFTLNQTVKSLNEMTGKNLQPRFEEERIGDVKHSLADISKGRETLGYRPIVPFKEGLKRTFEWYRLTE